MPKRQVTRTLTAEIARQVAASPRRRLKQYDEIEADAAAILARSDRTELNLDGIHDLSVESAAALSKFDGGIISLNGLRDLKHPVAEVLFRVNADLRLNGLAAFPLATAKHVGQHRKDLYLDGLGTISTGVAECLGNKIKYDDSFEEGLTTLSLMGLRKLTLAASKWLSCYAGCLYVPTAKFSDNVVDQLLRGVFSDRMLCPLCSCSWWCDSDYACEHFLGSVHDDNDGFDDAYGLDGDDDCVASAPISLNGGHVIGIFNGLFGMVTQYCVQWMLSNNKDRIRLDKTLLKVDEPVKTWCQILIDSLRDSGADIDNADAANELVTEEQSLVASELRHFFDVLWTEESEARFWYRWSMNEESFMAPSWTGTAYFSTNSRRCAHRMYKRLTAIEKKATKQLGIQPDRSRPRS